jgi:DNA-binding MurR/RpiR family transcriptional regulator
MKVGKMSDSNYIVKINTALSNKPFFVKITDPDLSVDRIFSEAISALSNTGRPLESQQLEQLYKQHQIFCDGKLIQKGDLFKDLKQKAQTVGDQSVTVAELDLVTSHSGGN